MTKHRPAWPWANREQLAIEAEAYETPEHTIEAILDVEILTPFVIDPCCGRGQMADAARARGYVVKAIDLYDWGAGITGIDWFSVTAAAVASWIEWSKKPNAQGFTVFMNPPFSLAEKFVEHARKLGARKIVCFQRHAWYETTGRAAFWAAHPPNRIYVSAKRASCWRISIPPEKRKSGTPTAHSWYVWEPRQPIGTISGRL